ncbi:zinc-binding dehydrogenase [Aeromicrobium sp. Leaf350]|uniref:alcohol dehydrogenase catalytic domain-containing protein n=1 Tax=Aeromicrobium sp. Leaf350 TaxID=2876565 RepID=UPI001E29F8C7|nr:zinc-binding dehydrogenase [Aeromicrobium sp. Leaf350]
MRAIRHHRFGPPDVLQLDDVPVPEPADGQLRIVVEAAGVHVLDTTIRSGDPNGPMALPELPTVPGREVAGVVDAVGPGVSADWIGSHVVAHLGFTSGGYAEMAVVAADRAYRVPDGLSSALAVAAIGTGRTAAGILTIAELTDDDVVAVTSAAGGLGVLLVQGAVGAGARVVGLASRAKRELVESLGAEFVDYGGDVPELSVVLDGVGGAVGRELFARLRQGGRLVRFGWSSGEQNAYADPERRVLDVLGPFMLENLTRFERESLAAAADGTRVPSVSAFDLADAAAAHRALEERRTTGKVVLLTGSAS